MLIQLLALSAPRWVMVEVVKFVLPYWTVYKLRPWILSNKDRFLNTINQFFWKCNLQLSLRQPFKIFTTYHSLSSVSLLVQWLIRMTCLSWYVPTNPYYYYQL